MSFAIDDEVKITITIEGAEERVVIEIPKAVRVSIAASYDISDMSYMDLSSEPEVSDMSVSFNPVKGYVGRVLTESIRPVTIDTLEI